MAESCLFGLAVYAAHALGFLTACALIGRTPRHPLDMTYLIVFVALVDLLTAAGARGLKLSHFWLSVTLAPIAFLIVTFDSEYPLQLGLLAVCWSHVYLIRLFQLWLRRPPRPAYQLLPAMEFS